MSTMYTELRSSCRDKRISTREMDNVLHDACFLYRDKKLKHDVNFKDIITTNAIILTGLCLGVDERILSQIVERRKEKRLLRRRMHDGYV